MYKYTYIQAAGGKRITKKYKVRVLTIAEERSPPGCNQWQSGNAAGRSTTPTPTGWRNGSGSGSGCPACLVRPACSLAQYLRPIFNGTARLV